MSVYIRGRGVFSVAGRTVSEHIQKLYFGEDVLREVTKDGIASFPYAISSINSRLSAFQIELRNVDSTVNIATAACLEAIEEAGKLPRHTGVIFGSSRGPARTLERLLEKHFRNERIPAYSSPISTANTIPSTISQVLGLNGMHLFVSGACSTGLHAVGVGYSMVKVGQLSTVIAGGVEHTDTAFFSEAMSRAKVLTSLTSSFPHRPQHPERDGMVLSSGAAALVLSKYREGAIAEIRGYGAATDHGGMAGVSRGLKGLQLAIDRCLLQAEVNKSEVSLIIGHGSSTQKGDDEELRALGQYFGGSLPPITYHKWLTGHMLGASAASSVAFACEHLEKDRYPTLPYMSEQSENSKTILTNVLVLSLGFGGNAAALLISKV